MTIDEKIEQAAREHSINPITQLDYTLGASFAKSEMLADMQKLADALGRALRPDVEYESLIAKEIVKKALSDFNVKYKEQK